MSCKDRSVTHLKSFGYNVIRLPKADIAPLQIFTSKKGTLQPLGDLPSVFIPVETVSVPAIKKDTAVASLSGQKTGDLSVGIGLNILGAVIGAMGGSKLGLDLQYKNARTVVFSYGDVTEDSIQVIDLDKYLSKSDVDPTSKHVAQLLEADEIFVITSVIKSKSITVEGKKKDNTDVKVDVPVIKEIVGGNIGVTTNSNSDSKVTYTGTIPLGFGFKAVRLFYDNGEYQRFDPAADGSIVVSLNESVANDGTLYISTSTFVDISN